MSERDSFAAYVEELGARVGTPVRCRKMRRPAYEYDGEWHEPYDEYEARSERIGGQYRVWTFDISVASLPRSLAAEVAAEVVRAAIDMHQQSECKKFAF